MKKVAIMLFLVGTIVRASQIKDEDIRFSPKMSNLRTGHFSHANSERNKNNLYKKLYKPQSEAHIHVSKVGDVAPEGYHKEGQFYVKNLPISTRHEYYNQFVEGYEPKEEFEERMLVNRHPDAMRMLGGEMSQEDINRREEILASPAYRVKAAQERKRLLDVEKGRVSGTRYMMPKQQGLWDRFTNWLWSFGQTNYGASANSQQEYEYHSFEPNQSPVSRDISSQSRE